LYRAYSSSAKDHFYTTDPNEMSNAVANGGFTAEGICGYIYSDQICGSSPLYRAYNAKGTDHFYTTDFNELQTVVTQSGLSNEGITGYVI